MTATLARRKEVLHLAQEHNFLILEGSCEPILWTPLSYIVASDDPYYFLYYGTAARPPSYFSLEKTVLGEVGRVLRCDSLSKVLSAGIRIGFASGPTPLLDVMDLHVRQRRNPLLDIRLTSVV